VLLKAIWLPVPKRNVQPVKRKSPMTKDLILSALHLAGDTLADPSRRTTGTLAENSKGFTCNPSDPEACKWCLTGALGKALHELKIDEPADQMVVYATMKETIGLDLSIAAPVFWDNNESLHELIAGRLQKAE
jgi:hypothetical protein